MAKKIDLAELDNHSAEVQAAIAFYASYAVTTTNYTREERARHYSVLEQAGYIEKVGAGNGVHIQTG